MGFYIYEYMKRLSYLCFFKNISDYLDGSRYIGLSFGLKVTIMRDFILLESIQCGDRLIEVPDGNILYGMVLWIDTILPGKVESVFIKNLKKQKCLKNAIFYPAEQIKIKRDEHGRLPQAKYFDYSDTIGVIHYCFEHNYFKLEDLSEEIQKRVKDILKIDLEEHIRGTKRAERFM